MARGPPAGPPTHGGWPGGWTAASVALSPDGYQRAGPDLLQHEDPTLPGVRARPRVPFHLVFRQSSIDGHRLP
jgi:hypothetical protein